MSKMSMSKVRKVEADMAEDVWRFIREWLTFDKRRVTWAECVASGAPMRAQAEYLRNYGAFRLVCRIFRGVSEKLVVKRNPYRRINMYAMMPAFLKQIPGMFLHAPEVYGRCLGYCPLTATYAGELARVGMDINLALFSGSDAMGFLADLPVDNECEIFGRCAVDDTAMMKLTLIPQEYYVTFLCPVDVVEFSAYYEEIFEQGTWLFKTNGVNYWLMNHRIVRVMCYTKAEFEGLKRLLGLSLRQTSETCHFMYRMF